MKSALTRVCCFVCSVGLFAQNTHTTLAWTVELFENMRSLVFSLALKIRVSMVRFRPRPPYIRRSKGNRATPFYCTNVARFFSRFQSNPLVSATKSPLPYFRISSNINSTFAGLFSSAGCVDESRNYHVKFRARY